jgi:hypothetical protein
MEMEMMRHSVDNDDEFLEGCDSSGEETEVPKITLLQLKPQLEGLAINIK